jgi:UDP-glucose 4-epimerase
MGTIMVAGGAGYIGSHTLWLLRQRGHDAFAFDNLSEGHASAVLDAELVRGDLADSALVERTLRERKVEAVFHFAAHCYVGESVTEPAKYYRNNVVTTLSLLESMRRAEVPYFVFSSTCATYGEPRQERMDESHPQWPVNPYGWTKFMVERMLADFDRAYGLKSVCLRYFNAAGAHPEGLIGEDHDPETHLIPLVLGAAAGRRPALKVFGADWPTPDGSCIRDYIHILDLADAHLRGLEYLRSGQPCAAFNLGNGAGYSVLEVIRAAEAVTGKKVPFELAPRRAGDPARLVGDCRRAAEVLGWKQAYADLPSILSSAWRWHERHPDGFKD